MRKKLALFSSLLALPVVLADPVQDAFDTVFNFITPEIANYLYTFILVFAISQFALGLVLQNRPGGRVAHPDRNSAAIAAALAFGAAFFVYLSNFDMILFTIPWILFITFGMLSLMVYRVVQLFGSGTPSRTIRYLAIGISLLIASAFIKAITAYIEQYERVNQISKIGELSSSIFGGLTSITGWLAVIGFFTLIYAAYLWVVERNAPQHPAPGGPAPGGPAPGGPVPPVLPVPGGPPPLNATFTVHEFGPPLGPDIGMGNDVLIGYRLEFRGLPAPGGTGPYIYTWDFAGALDPTDPIPAPGPNPIIQNAFGSPGPKIVTLNLQDNAGAPGIDYTYNLEAI